MKTTTTQTGTNAETRRTQWSAKQIIGFFLCAAPRPWRLCACLLLVTVTTTFAATNDLSGLLQKGLFEEEANRNLEAATAAYQTLVTQLDKDRQIGATAIFRLGEVYRKQGKTNEAAAQYERIVRDFAEQTTLVTLSRQNLSGLGLNQIVLRSEIPSVVTGDMGNLYDEATTLTAKLEGLKTFQSDPEKHARAVISLFPDEKVKKMLANLPKLREQEAKLKANPSVTLNPYYVASNFEPLPSRNALTSPNTLELAAAETQQQIQLIAKRVDEIIGEQAIRLEVLQALAKASKASEPPLKSSMTSTVMTVADEEEAEIRRIQGMIQNSPDLINAQSGDPSMTPLGRAASKGQLRVAGFLLDHGADLNLNLPLSQAAGNGHKAMVELLLKYGAPVNAATSSGGTALQRAAQRGFVSVVEVLLNAKADPNLRDDTDRTALTLAAENNFASVAAALLARGANPNIVCKTRNGWGSDRTTCGAPIHFAITRTGDALLALLLTNRADVMLRNPFGETPLDMAASLGLASKAKQLIAAGAEIDPARAASSGRAAPLYYAVSSGRHEVAALLLEHGANPNVCTLSGQEGVTPLMTAAGKGDTEMVALLLKHKAEPNLADSKNNTALLNAIQARSAKAVRVLVAGGANPNTTSANGLPVLMFAMGDIRDSEMVAALIEAKVKVNATDASAKTPLHYAVMANRKDLVELLLAAGADANARDQAGKTPLDYTKPSPLPSPAVPGRVTQFPGGAPASAAPVESKPADIAGLLRQHGALDELPDFSRIRITRQEGLAQPLEVFVNGPRMTNHFTLLETIMRFYSRESVYWDAQRANSKAYAMIQFPDFGRIIIRRPSPKLSGKEQEIKVSLLNGKGALDCAKDVPVQFGDVIEIPERVHALNAALDDPVNEMEAKFRKVQRVAEDIRKPLYQGLSKDHPTMVQFAKQKAEADAAIENLTCLRKSVQLVVAGTSTPLAVDSWKEGFLSQALSKIEARTALRSSSDLTRVQVKRTNAKTGKLDALTVDATDTNDSLWLQDGDVIEVPDKR